MTCSNQVLAKTSWEQNLDRTSSLGLPPELESVTTDDALVFEINRKGLCDRVSHTWSSIVGLSIKDITVTKPNYKNLRKSRKSGESQAKLKENRETFGKGNRQARNYPTNPVFL